MNKLLTTILATILLTAFIACGDDHDHTTDYEYHAHILSPNSDTKNIGDTIHLHVNFESHAGETVHHVNVRVYNKAGSSEIYNGPQSAHVHAENGSYDLHDNIILSEENGFSAHSDWVIEAKVWGHEAGEGEVVESVEFHLHP